MSTPPSTKGDVGTAVDVEVEGDSRGGISDTVLLMVLAVTGCQYSVLLVYDLIPIFVIFSLVFEDMAYRPKHE